ncbi:MAG: hypothetical protein IJF07_08260, partial [Lachnospiraceae bacterium]|nr:hypothetical protein [Lachnospiraceae bacterium]
MQLIRMFSTDNYKGTPDYLNTQKRYEILRTIIYFAISISLFVAGWIHTGSRENLLTIVAILGCLPACKSVVDMIMFLRYQSCSTDAATQIEAHIGSLKGLFDMVFTSYDKTYQIAHITVRGNTICGYTEDADFEEQAFYKHIDTLLKKDSFKDTSIKVFSDLKKY